MTIVEDTTLTVDGDGLELPEKYVGSDGFVVRTPRVTIDSKTGTSENPFGPVKPRDWDDEPERIRNQTALEDGGLVGLKPYGEDQEWYPVEMDT